MTPNLQTLINSEIDIFEKGFPVTAGLTDSSDVLFADFLRSMATRIATATADGLMVEQWRCDCNYVNGSCEHLGFNGALTAIDQKRGEFFEIKKSI